MAAPPGTPGASPAYPPMFPGAVPGMPSPWDAERQKQIDRTRTGILLLLIGTLIGWAPIIQIIGSLLLLIGAVLVILGRKAFGPLHSRYVVLSIVIAIVGFVVTFFAGLVIGFSFVSASLPGGAPTQAALQAALTNSLIVALIGTVIAGIASVLFTFALQDKMGRMLLLAGYGASIAVQVVLFVILTPLIPSTVAAMFPGGTFDQNAAIVAAASFQAKAAVWAYLSVIPALLFALADYFVWTRIKKGEIPAPSTPPGMATTPAPIQPR